MAKPKQKKKSKKKKVSDTRGVANIKATFNNTHISVTDKFGNVIAWATAGTSGLKDLARIHRMQLQLQLKR